MYTDMFEILDDNGVIYSGNEAEMQAMWEDIETNEEEIKWSGDLKLVQIHNIIA